MIQKIDADAINELANDFAEMALVIASTRGYKPAVMLGAMAVAATALTIQHSKPGMEEISVKKMIELINAVYPQMLETTEEIRADIAKAEEARKKGSVQ